MFEMSSLMALEAARALPGGVLRLGTSAGVGAARSGQVLGAAVLDDYRKTLGRLREVGYAAYARRQLTPYVRAAANQFSPGPQYPHRAAAGEARGPPRLEVGSSRAIRVRIRDRNDPTSTSQFTSISYAGTGSGR